MSSYIKALILVLLTLYMAMIFESTSLALLGFTVAVLLVCSFLYLFVLRKKISVDLKVPISIAQKARPFFIQVIPKSLNGHFTPKIKIWVEYSKSNEKKKKTICFPLAIGRKKTNEFSVEIRDAGNYVFSVKKIGIYDLTGLFYWTKTCRAEANALVLPDLTAIPVEVGDRVRNFFGDADTFDDLRPGYDPSETFDVREFRDGDRIQKVHWKLSAKSDNLMVRENSLPKACPVVLFLSPKSDTWDKQLGLAASVSFSLMDAGCPHFAAWYSASHQELMRTRVDDEESFYLFLTTLMQDAVFDEHQDIITIYRQKYRGENYLYELEIDREGSLLQNGRKQEKRESESMELILK